MTPATDDFAALQARLRLRDEIYFQARAAGLRVPLPNPEINASELKITARLWATTPDLMARAGVDEVEVARHFPKPAPITAPVVQVAVPVAERPVDGAWAMPGLRPRVSSVVHLWDENNGTCATAFVADVLGGAPTAGVVVSEVDPYLKVTVLGGRRPVHARYIAAPTKNLSPGFRSPISSWHRPAECSR